MKYLRATILASTLTIVFSTTALAGNIGMRTTGNIGMRTTGNIGMRTTGNIGMRTTGNIGMRGVGQTTHSSLALRFGVSRADFEGMFSFTGLIRMLLESGALL